MAKLRYRFKRYPKNQEGLYMFEILDSERGNQEVYTFWQVSPIPAPRAVRKIGLANTRWHLDGIETKEIKDLR